MKAIRSSRVLRTSLLAATSMAAACGGVTQMSPPDPADAAVPHADATAPDTTGHDADDGEALEVPAACAICGPLEGCWAATLCVAKQVPLQPEKPHLGLIDITEVTRSQYAAWLSLGPDASNQPETCSWNSTFAPSADCLNDPYVCSGADCGDHPQVCVDWCDAYGYCRSIGKRLCGHIGGGALSFTSIGSAAKSQWYAACSWGGSTAYPYGDLFVLDACQVAEYSTAPVASHAQCRTKSGAFDLSGNASEWEDACSWDAPDVKCRWRGGNFANAAPDLVLCMGVGAQSPNAALHGGGFRCCSDP